jgi:hypothetical protein
MFPGTSIRTIFYLLNIETHGGSLGQSHVAMVLLQRQQQQQQQRSHGTIHDLPMCEKLYSRQVLCYQLRHILAECTLGLSGLLGAVLLSLLLVANDRW